MTKLSLALTSPGNWMLVAATGLGLLQQVRPCLTGKAGLTVDAVIGLVGGVGVVWNTFHLHQLQQG